MTVYRNDRNEARISFTVKEWCAIGGVMIVIAGAYLRHDRLLTNLCDSVEVHNKTNEKLESRIASIENHLQTHAAN